MNDHNISLNVAHYTKYHVVNRVSDSDTTVMMKQMCVQTGRRDKTERKGDYVTSSKIDVLREVSCLLCIK